MPLHKKSIVVLLSPLWDSVVSRIIIHLHQICRITSCLYAECGEVSRTEVRYSVCLGAAFSWILFILCLRILFSMCVGNTHQYYGISQRLIISKTFFFSWLSTSPQFLCFYCCVCFVVFDWFVVFTAVHKRLAERAVILLYKRQSHWSCTPDGSSGVDLCHHLLPPTDGTKISHFPHGVVFDNIAHSEGGAGATLVEGFAVFRMRQGT